MVAKGSVGGMWEVGGATRGPQEGPWGGGNALHLDCPVSVQVLTLPCVLQNISLGKWVMGSLCVISYKFMGL